MSNFTITAESVVDAVIQDGQVQTTNRSNLLNYVNRVHQRMLRESQWLFLRSPEQRFVTQPDAAKYWLSSGTPPPGVVATGLNLTDVASIIPDYVFDLTNSRQLTKDSQAVLTGPTLRYKDGSFRSAQPRTFEHEYNNPNVLHLFPPPDGANSYVPIPASPVCNYIAGGALAYQRNYYILVTVVDSIGNESVPCLLPSNIVVPENNLLTVSPPFLEIPLAASLVAYEFYNVYVAQNISGPYYKQNNLPIGTAFTWQEPVTGVTNVIGPQLQYNILNSSSQLFGITVVTDGTLMSTSQLGGIIPGNLILVDSSNVSWEVGVLTDGTLTTTVSVGGVTPGVILADTDGAAWQLGVLTDGTLTTTNVGLVTDFTFPAPLPPSVSNLTPINGYVISFFYQRQRTQIAATTDLLQIPYQYFDVVVAGVNYYANMYTSKAEDVGMKAGAWKKEFMEGLAQMRRDLRINFRNNDIIMPDPQTQYSIGTQAGYSYAVQQ